MWSKYSDINRLGISRGKRSINPNVIILVKMSLLAFTHIQNGLMLLYCTKPLMIYPKYTGAW